MRRTPRAKPTTRMQRRTRQREAIGEVLREAARPLSPLEVFQGACRRVGGLGMATVYRTLKGLVAERRVVHVELPGQAARYELAGKAHHHHFSCRACGRVFEIEGCPGDLSALTPRGFEAEAHEVILYGRCATCVPKRSGRRRA